MATYVQCAVTTADVTGLQHHLGSARKGDSVDLIRERDNVLDASAIIAFIGGNSIGMLSRSDAARLAPLLDAPHHLRALLLVSQDTRGLTSLACCHVDIHRRADLPAAALAAALAACRAARKSAVAPPAPPATPPPPFDSPPPLDSEPPPLDAPPPLDCADSESDAVEEVAPQKAGAKRPRAADDAGRDGGARRAWA